MPQLLAQSGGLILGNCDGALLKRSKDFVVGSIFSSLLAPSRSGIWGELNHTGGKKTRTFARGFMHATRC